MTNTADPDQTPHNVASYQGLSCLLTGFSIKHRIKAQNQTNTPKITNGLAQHITVEESTSIQWAKFFYFHFLAFFEKCLAKSYFMSGGF